MHTPEVVLQVPLAEPAHCASALSLAQMRCEQSKPVNPWPHTHAGVLVAEEALQVPRPLHKAAGVPALGQVMEQLAPKKLG